MYEVEPLGDNVPIFYNLTKIKRYPFKVALICNIILAVNMPPFPGIMRMFSPLLLSSSTARVLATTTTIAIAIIILASNVTVAIAQQQLASQRSVIENGTVTGTALSIEDSFSVQVPRGWVIHDVRNVGFTLGAEVLQGYGILAQLCPEEQQQQSEITNDSGVNTSTSRISSSNSCQGAQGEVIHVVRYPNLGTRLGISSDDIIGNDDVTPDIILGYQMQKLQEAGYRDIRIMNSTDTTINVDLSAGLNNNTMRATVPAKLVEMTYSTNLAPNETRRAYFISTATNATPPNLGTIKGYAVFYEGNSTNSTATTAAEITTISGSLLPPATVRQVFDSFELIVAPEVAQAIAQEAAEGESLPMANTTGTNTTGTNATGTNAAEITEAVETAQGGGDDNGDDNAGEGNAGEGNAGEGDAGEGDGDDNGGDGNGADTACDSSYPDDCIRSPPPDLDCGDDGIPENFEVLPPDPHNFDPDNDGIGCESESNQQSDLDEEPGSPGSSDPLTLSDIISRAIDGLNSSPL
jgi:hypothetical protein